MALNKTAVFLASRFNEFAELRRKLKELIASHRTAQLAPIDLNDGHVSHRPPLAECLSYVRRSEFMILLLGDSYGSLAPRSNKSFTHLEYEEAIREDSSTRVLVFGIGEHYRAGVLRYAADERLAAWQRQLEENHTLGFFDPETPVDEVAKSIFEKLLATLYEMRFGELDLDEQNDEVFDSLGEESWLDDAEVSALEERNARRLSLVEDRSRFANTLAALTQPAAVAALEQREEAQRALDIREWGVAIRHLRRALEFKPLELIANYWLAQLYVALGRKEKAPQALELAQRAARIAEHDGLPYRASAAWMIAARAARLAGRSEEALDCARQAVEAAPRYSRAYIELARQCVIGEDRKTALAAIRKAFEIYPRSLREVFADGVFRPLRQDIDELLRELKKKIERDVADLLRVEGDIARLAGRAAVDISLEGKTFAQLLDAGRQSANRQYRHVGLLLAEAARKVQDLHTEAPPLPPATQETLRFNRPGRARIVQWLKAPGDIIQPGEAVFYFQYEGSSKVVPWMLRGRAAVRMSARAGEDGVWVTSDAQYLFEHIPADSEMPVPSLAQRLRTEIGMATQKVENGEARLRECQSRQNQAAEALDALRRQGMTRREIGMWALSAIAVALSLILYSDHMFYAVLAGAAAAYGAKAGVDQRRTYRRQLESRRRAFDEATQAVNEALAAKNNSSAMLAAARRRLEDIEAECEQARQRALDALARFEGVTLRKGARLLPFPSIFSASEGEVARVLQGQLDQFKEQAGREIVVQEDLPQWMVANPKARLLRVVEASPQRLILSPWLAYFDAREET